MNKYFYIFLLFDIILNIIMSFILKKENKKLKDENLNLKKLLNKEGV